MGFFYGSSNVNHARLPVTSLYDYEFSVSSKHICALFPPLPFFGIPPWAFAGECREAERHLMDEGKQGRLLSPVDVADASRKSDSAVSSPDSADAPPTPPDPRENGSVQPDSEPHLGQTTALESPSSTVGPQRNVTSKDECLKARKRPAEESPESLIPPQKPRPQPNPSEFQPSAESVFDSMPTSHASTSTHPKVEELESEDKYVVHQAELAHLISLIKTMKNSETAGEQASPPHALESSHLPPLSQKQGGRWDSEVWKAVVKPKLASVPAAVSTGIARFEAAAEKIPSRSVSTADASENQPDALTVVKKEILSPGVAGNQNPGQDPQPLSAAATDGAAVCQRPVNFTEANGGHQSAPAIFAPASGHDGAASGTSGQLPGSAEDASASNNAPAYNASSRAPESRASAEQDAAGFGRAARGGVEPEAQQQQMLQQQQQQIQQLLQQQQMLQQQLHQFQLQQMQQYQLPPPPLPPQMHQDPVKQQQQLHQYQMHQYQFYQQQQQSNQQYQQQMHLYQLYQQQQSNQDLQQQYSQYHAGNSLASYQSNLLHAQANVEYDMGRIPTAPGQESHWRNNIPPVYPSPSNIPNIPAANNPNQ